MIQLPCLSTESPAPGLKNMLLFLTPLQNTGRLSFNLTQFQSAPPEENSFVAETVRVVLNIKYLVTVSLLAKTFINQSISSDQFLQSFIVPFMEIVFCSACFLQKAQKLKPLHFLGLNCPNSLVRQTSCDQWWSEHLAVSGEQ